jgi:putative flippase GtrA
MADCQTGLERMILIVPNVQNDESVPKLKQLANHGFAAVFFCRTTAGSKQNKPKQIDKSLPLFSLNDSIIPVCACVAFAQSLTENTINSVCIADIDAPLEEICRMAQVHSLHPSEMLAAVCENTREVSSKQKILRIFLRFFAGMKADELSGGIYVLPTAFAKGLRMTVGPNLWRLDVILSATERSLPVCNIPTDIPCLQAIPQNGLPLKYLPRLLRLFLKFMFSSMVSYLCDILLFGLMIHLTKSALPELYIYVSTAAARIVSALINYFINRTVVFQSKQKNTFHRYVLLACIIYFMSAFFTDTTVKLSGWPEIPVKLVVDGILFLVNYHMQRKYIFHAEE